MILCMIKFYIMVSTIIWSQILKILGFTYCKSMQIAQNVKLPTDATGCNCKGTCMDPKTCACTMLNGSDFPYVQRDGGR